MQGNLKDAKGSACLLEVKFEIVLCHAILIITSIVFLAGDRRQEREIQSNLH